MAREARRAPPPTCREQGGRSLGAQNGFTESLRCVQDCWDASRERQLQQDDSPPITSTSCLVSRGPSRYDPTHVHGTLKRGCRPAGAASEE